MTEVIRTLNERACEVLKKSTTQSKQMTVLTLGFPLKSRGLPTQSKVEGKVKIA